LDLEIPDLEVFQAYVTLPNFDNEMRIRRLINLYTGEVNYCLTFKTSGTLSRQEFEVAIPVWLFDSLKTTTTKQLLKNIHFIAYANHRLEFHVYTDKSLAGLIIMECEFTNEQEAVLFRPPHWLDIAKEVTEDIRYQNKNLATSGIPS